MPSSKDLASIPGVAASKDTNLAAVKDTVHTSLWRRHSFLLCRESSRLFVSSAR